jgi:hypothetical protein
MGRLRSAKLGLVPPSRSNPKFNLRLGKGLSKEDIVCGANRLPPEDGCEVPRSLLIANIKSEFLEDSKGTSG